MTTPREGWVSLLNTRKDHYIVDDRSLCGRWGFLGKSDRLAPDAGPNPNDCRECRRKLERRQKVATIAAAVGQSFVYRGNKVTLVAFKDRGQPLGIDCTVQDAHGWQSTCFFSDLERIG